jgi:hypothetical protein
MFTVVDHLHPAGSAPLLRTSFLWPGACRTPVDVLRLRKVITSQPEISPRQSPVHIQPGRPPLYGPRPPAATPRTALVRSAPARRRAAPVRPAPARRPPTATAPAAGTTPRTAPARRRAAVVRPAPAPRRSPAPRFARPACPGPDHDPAARHHPHYANFWFQICIRLIKPVEVTA